MLRQRILGEGRRVEDRFWKYRRSNWKMVKKNAEKVGRGISNVQN